jgi:NTP pyrophosphatase (non-canonical NTP hydrolase)
MTWLHKFADAAGKTDRFVGSAEHVALLAAGLMGEAGSVLTELKKEKRERDAYPAYRHRMQEEIGDFLWYFVRLVSVVDRPLLAELEAVSKDPGGAGDTRSLPVFLELGAAVGGVLAFVSKTGAPAADLRPLLLSVWKILLTVSREAQVPLEAAADRNIRKIESRWPTVHVYSPLFDDDFPEEEQLPRRLEIEFRERSRGEQKVVILRCNGINFGDRLTDNILDPDGYRYHDIFHFAHAVHLGWSPVVRAVLRCKRKSSSQIDEGEDGARAAILEEAVAAIVFSRAKELNLFEGLHQLDYDLLKTIREFVQGYEVESVPLWQWEMAILDGYATFRKLRSTCGGRVVLDLAKRELRYTAPQ